MRKIVAFLTCLTILALAVQAVAAPQKDERRLRRDMVLHFKPATIEAPQSSKSFAVVKFRDLRDKKNIGETQKYDVYSEPDIADWIGYSFYEQLLYNGYNVQYFNSMEQVKGVFDFIITGEVNEYFFSHNALLQFQAAADVTFFAYGKQVDVTVAETPDKTITQVKTKDVTIKRNSRETEYRTALGVNFDDEVLADELANLFDDILSEFMFNMNEIKTRP